MKKMMRSLFSLVLVMVMVMGLSTVAFATEATPKNVPKPEGGFTLTIKNPVKNPGTLSAYQIFAGTLAQKGEGVDAKLILSDVTWGSAIPEGKQGDLMTALKANTAFAACETAADVAKALNGATDDGELAQAFATAIANFLETLKEAEVEVKVAGSASEVGADGTIKIGGLEPGYYLVMSDAPAGTENYAATRYMLEVVGNVEVAEKADIPSVEKKVQDINDSNSTDPDNGKWKDTADWDIGDEVHFQLTGTLPSNYDDYEKYKYIFHDTLSPGLTYVGITKIYVEYENGGSVEITAQIGEQANPNYPKISSSGQELTISFENLKNIIETLDPENKAKIVVEYTATLNENAIIGSEGNPNEVFLEFSNNPNDGGEGTGKTPTDKVIVFTFELDVDKVQKSANPEKETDPLEGAGFTLYKLVKTETGKEEFVPLYFKKVGERYVIDDAVHDEDEKAELSGTDMTTFQFGGLDDGIYRLEETTVPAGFNKAEPIEFVITGKHNDADLKLESVEFTLRTGASADAATDADITYGTDDGAGGKIGYGDIKVLNQKGSQLPSTGGIGTTIFYVIGSILVIVAVVLLVTKKRMSHQDQ